MRISLDFRYTDCLDKAKKLGIVSEYTAAIEAYQGRANHAVPYFSGDVWPNLVHAIASRNRMVRSKVNLEHEMYSRLERGRERAVVCPPTYFLRRYLVPPCNNAVSNST